MDNNRHLAVLGADAIAFLTVTLFESVSKSKKTFYHSDCRRDGLEFQHAFMRKKNSAEHLFYVMIAGKNR